MTSNFDRIHDIIPFQIIDIDITKTLWNLEGFYSKLKIEIIR